MDWTTIIDDGDNFDEKLADKINAKHILLISIFGKNAFKNKTWLNVHCPDGQVSRRNLLRFDILGHHQNRS